MNSITNGAERKKPGLLINRDYGLLWLGGAVSVFGDVIYDFTLVVWITLFLANQQPWAPLAVSGVLVASLGTMFLFGPVAGVFVDRWDKRRTMLVMDALRVALVALLIPVTNAFPLPFLPDGRLPLVAQLVAMYAIVFLASLCGQFFIPAKIALIGDIVPEAYRAQASGLSQMAQSLAMLLAPAFAPLLALTLGVEWAIVINALTFAFSFLMIALIQAPQAATSQVDTKRGAALRELLSGLALTARNKYLSALVIAVAVVSLGAATINALDIFFAIHNLQVQPQWYGLLSSALGVGMLGGSLAAGALAQRVGLVRVFNLSLLATGALIVVYSRLTSFVPALVVILIAGVVQAMLNTVAAPLLLRVTPRQYVGRVASIVNSSVALSQVIGTILTGYLAGTVLVNLRQSARGFTFGPYDLLIGGGGVIVALGGLYALARLGVRDPVAPADDEQTAIAALADAPETTPAPVV
jgi:MFS family permease